jgi:hypothetical protein
MTASAAPPGVEPHAVAMREWELSPGPDRGARSGRATVVHAGAELAAALQEERPCGPNTTRIL